MFDEFDIYGCSIGPDYEELILEAQEREDFCPGIAVIAATLPPARTAGTEVCNE